MKTEIDLTALGLEDFMYFLELADPKKLALAERALQHEVSGLIKKQQRLALLQQYLNPNDEGGSDTEGQDPGKGTEVVTPTTSLPASVSAAPPLETAESGSTKQTDLLPILEKGVGKEKKKGRTARGTVTTRNQFIVDFVEGQDNWQYRIDFEEAFKLSEWVNEGDNVREVVRQFLRQARSSNILIERRAYTISPINNHVMGVLMYGLPKFVAPEGADKYKTKFLQKVKELGLFATESEAIQFQESQNGISR